MSNNWPCAKAFYDSSNEYLFFDLAIVMAVYQGYAILTVDVGVFARFTFTAMSTLASCYFLGIWPKISLSISLVDRCGDFLPLNQV